MKKYQLIHDNFLLDNKYAQELYHNYAAKMPIIDYHCHLSPQAIASDRIFENTNTTGFTFSSITGYDNAAYTANFAQDGSNYDLSFTAVPEPSTWVLLIAGLGGLVVLRRRKLS